MVAAIARIAGPLIRTGCDPIWHAGKLNAVWGTAFWSYVYTEWSQVPVPLETGGVPNPGLDLDFRRFMSDTFVGFQQEQVEILAVSCPGHFITHNFMGFGFDQINYYDLAKPLDFVSWDNYPRTGWHLAKEADLQNWAKVHGNEPRPKQSRRLLKPANT